MTNKYGLRCRDTRGACLKFSAKHIRNTRSKDYTPHEQSKERGEARGFSVQRTRPTPAQCYSALAELLLLALDEALLFLLKVAFFLGLLLSTVFF